MSDSEEPGDPIREFLEDFVQDLREQGDGDAASRIMEHIDPDRLAQLLILAARTVAMSHFHELRETFVNLILDEAGIE